MKTYSCTDDASGGVTIEMTGESAEAVLAEYITDALTNPGAYNQGEEGVASRIRAIVTHDDEESGEIEEAQGWIEFTR